MTTITDHDITTSRLRLHYLEAGNKHRQHASRQRSLLLIHGWPQTAYCWRKVIPALAEHFHVIAPDLRGFGGSDKTGLPLSRAQLAADMVSLLDALQLDCVHVVGHDWGGMVALKMALDFPDRVDHLALLDCSTTHWPHWAAHGLWAKVPGWAEHYFARCHDTFIRWCFAGTTATYPEDVVSPFPAQAMSGLDWCEPAALEHYLANMSQPATQAASVSLYRDALPFYQQQADGHWERVDAGTCKAIWQHPGGPFRHPEYRNAICFAPEDLGKCLDHPALYVYTPMLQPKGFDTQGQPLAGYSPAGDRFSDSLAAPFRQLQCAGMQCGHFIPEEQPVLLAKHLLDFLPGTDR